MPASDHSLLTAEMLAGDDDRPLVATDRGDVRFILFNRPAARNALTRDMRRDFARLLSEAEGDESVRVVVVTGTGGVFSAGVDIKETRNGPPRPIVRPHPGEVLRAMTKPVIAAVDGPCVTGGLEIALSCSFIIASDRARFADTHARVGLVPAWGLSALLPRAVGRRRALQMALTGAFIDARTACDWGLVNKIVDGGGLLNRCLEIAAEIGRADADSVRLQHRILYDQDGAPLQAALLAEEDMVVRWRTEKNLPLA